MTRSFLGHPIGLTVCILTEVWERFAYYGTLSMLILYLTKFYLLSDAAGNLTMGAVGALLLVSPVLGGTVADRWLGSQRSIMVGCVFMSFGFISISLPDRLVSFLHLDTGTSGLPDLNLLLVSLAIVIVGNGLVKSSLADVVGSLYLPGDREREVGFTFVYWAVNFGAFAGPIACGAVGQTYGMRYGFSIAGVGMFIALITFAFGKKFLPHQEEPASSRTLRERIPSWLTLNRLICLGGGLSIILVWQLLKMHTWLSGMLTWFGVILGTFILYFSFRHCSARERDQTLMIGVVVFLGVIFSAINFQIYGSLVLFGDRYVNRSLFDYEIPASMIVSMIAFTALWLTPLDREYARHPGDP